LLIYQQRRTITTRSDLIAMFARNKLSTTDRLGLLIGQTEEEKDHIICSCFNVGTKKILKEIKEQNLTTTEEITEALQAGSNCGSCIPELKALLCC
jgi:assimilatory nitrate reductase catalytic subunit